MSTEDLPQSAELASAYLDGELVGPERAAAEAAPEVAAAIESFTRVRAALGETGSIDPTAKESAISAALAEFDAVHATSTSVIVPAATSTAPAATTGLAPVVPLQPRRHRAFTAITGAAAAAIVVVVAVAAINSNQDTDDSATFASEAPAAVVADTTPQLKSLTAAAAATEAAPAEATDSAAGAAAADDAATAVPEIESPAALTEYAASMEIAATTAAPAATAAPPATQAASSPSDQAPAPGGYAAVACLSSVQIVIGSITYQGTPALAVHNTATGTLQAIADTDCRVLDEVPSP